MSNTTSNFTLPFELHEIIAPSVLIWTFFFVGIILNTLTIVVIATNKKLKNPFMTFILSLCVSDLLSALISPFFWYRRTFGFDVWNLPKFLCTIYWAGDLWTSYVTSLHILSFAILRYISIKYPNLYKRIDLRMTKIYIVCLWIFCFLIGFIPYSIFFGASTPNRSSLEANARWPACTVLPEYLWSYILYIRVGYPIFLILPIVVVFVMSWLIAISVHTHVTQASTGDSRISRKKKEKMAVLQLFLIAMTFIFAYIPFVAYEVWATGDIPSGQYWRDVDFWFGMTEYLFLRFSECMNPVFYNLGSNKMRKCTAAFLKNRFCCRKTIQDRGVVDASTDGVTTGTTNNLGV